MERSKPLRTDMKPACGPPNPSGTPNLCALPTAMSAFSSPGDFNKVRLNRSQSIIDRAPQAVTLAIACDKSFISPVEFG